MVSKPDIEQSQAELCDLFRLLSDHTRLQIVLFLATGEHTVTDLCNALNLPQPTVSHHLGLLRMNRLIVNERQGKKVIYSLGASAKSLKKTLKFSVPPYVVTVDEAR
jgi:DNA-binding transcriptional ArsR family regulator